MKSPGFLSRFIKSSLRGSLVIGRIGILRKGIKAAIGSGKFYRKLIKVYLKTLDEIRPETIPNNSYPFNNFPPIKSERRIIYADITSLTNRDAGGGIQRTQKKFLEFTSNIKKASIVPIAFEGNNFYKVQVITGTLNDELSFKRSNELISIGRDDVFLSLDLNYLSLILNFDFYLRLSNQGTEIWFLVYDLLPIDYPSYFSNGISELHESWLNNLLKIANVICISKTVQENLNNYIHKRKINRKNLLNLQVYLGADFNEISDYSQIKNAPQKRKKFIAVGTLEPRKGYHEILDVCDILWAKGEIFELHLIGKLGWKSEELEKRVTQQSGTNPNLFWHSKATDKDLDYHYATCDALIAASFDEGFGLPIVEALRRGKVVFARKIKIFEEVMGKSELFFESRKDLELIVSEYLQNSNLEKYCGQPDFKCRSWKESAQEVIETVLLSPHTGHSE